MRKRERYKEVKTYSIQMHTACGKNVIVYLLCNKNTGLQLHGQYECPETSQY